MTSSPPFLGPYSRSEKKMKHLNPIPVDFTCCFLEMIEKFDLFHVKHTVRYETKGRGTVFYLSSMQRIYWVNEDILPVV